MRAAARHTSSEPDRVSSVTPAGSKPSQAKSSKVQAFRSTEMSEGLSSAGVDGLNGSTRTTAEGESPKVNGHYHSTITPSSIVDFAMLMHSLKVGMKRVS